MYLHSRVRYVWGVIAQKTRDDSPHQGPSTKGATKGAAWGPGLGGRGKQQKRETRASRAKKTQKHLGAPDKASALP